MYYTTENHTPQIYVGTYAKYNNGSLFGKWLDLTDYESAEDFYNACKELHQDEHDPEFMFQDYEYIPNECIGESWIDPLYFDFMQLDEYEQIKVLAVLATNATKLEVAMDERDHPYITDDPIRTFDELYFDLTQMADNNTYVRIDYDQYINDNWTECTINDQTYYIESHY